MSGRVVVGLSTSGTRLAMVLWAAAEAGRPRCRATPGHRRPTAHGDGPVPGHRPDGHPPRRGAAAAGPCRGGGRDAPSQPAGIRRDGRWGAGRGAAGRGQLGRSAGGRGRRPEPVRRGRHRLGARRAADHLAVPAGGVPWTEQTVDRDAPVLVALDEPGTSPGALAYGFAAAERARRPLRVLRCLPDGRDDAPQTETRRFGSLHPYVEVIEETVPGDPRDVLVAHSRRVALVVLGSHGHGRLASTLFGSVSRDLIRRSGCPVVVIRPLPAHHAALASS